MISLIVLHLKNCKVTPTFLLFIEKQSLHPSVSLLACIGRMPLNKFITNLIVDVVDELFDVLFVLFGTDH